jgi:regulation of enolase protein 1 (concanavalin A-like superfamily)
MKARTALSLSALFLAGALSSPSNAAIQLLSATGFEGRNEVGVQFSDPFTAATAIEPNNYKVNGTIAVHDVSARADGKSVTLLSQDPPAAGSTLVVNNVQDASGNAIAANSTVPITLSNMKAEDVGDVVDAGTVTPLPNGEFDVYAGGRAIWAAADSFNFVYEERTGDFDVKVQIGTYTSADDQVRAGLMMRGTTDPGSKNVDLIAYRSERQLWGMTFRADDAGQTAQPFATAAPVNPPNSWLRMKRVGSDLTVYFATDGFNWTNTFKQTVDFPDKVLVGLATMATEGATTDRVYVNYKNYGDTIYAGSSINITGQPQNVSTLAGTTATFTVTAEAQNAPQREVSYQWQKDGVNIPGATSASYTTGLLSTTDSGAKYKVLLKLPGASATSSEVTLTVNQDSTPPSVTAAYGLQNGTAIGLLFSEALDNATATDPANYQVSGGLTLDSVILGSDSKTATLVLSAGGAIAADTTVTINGVKDLSGNTVAANTNIKVTLLPLISADVGDAVPSQVAAVGSGDIEVLAGGRDIWGTDDSFNFIYEEKTGDFDVEVQIADYKPVSNNARAGLMVRETLDAGSRNIDAILYPISRQIWGVTVRDQTSFDTSQPLAGQAPTSLPDSWLRIRRNGTLISVYYGKDGVTWIRSFTKTVDYPDKVLVGMATTSNDNSDTGRIPVSYRNFRDFTIANSTLTISQQPTPLTIRAGQTATFTVAAQVTGAAATELIYQWQKNGINIPGANSGSFTTAPLSTGDDGAKYKVVLSIPGTTVTSQEAAVTVTQDTSAPTVVSALAYGDWNSVSITFSEPLDPASKAAENFTVSGGLTVNDTILSSDQSKIVLNLSAPAQTGATITINNVKDLSGNAIGANTVATVTVLPLKVADVGDIATPSTVLPISGSDFDVIAGGSDIWASADGFNFVYTQKTGDFDVKVQIIKEQQEDPNAAISTVARASLMMRESLDPGSRNIDIIVYPVGRQLWGVTFRAETGEATAQPAAPVAPVAFPNVWVRMQRVGNDVTCYYGIDGVNWLQSIKIDSTAANTAAYPADVLVGAATVSANNTAGGRMEVDYRNFSDFVPPADTTPPTLVSAARDPADATKVIVIFSEPVGAATANTSGNYQVSGGINVTGAALGADKKTVTLTTSSIAAGSDVTLTVSGVSDIAGNPIVASSQIHIDVPSPALPRVQDSGADGLLVLEAEHFSSKIDSADGHSWTLVTTPAGFSGTGAMSPLPNSTLNVQNDITISPRMDFNVRFTKTGTQYIWIRGVGDSGGASVDDSVHVGLDGVLLDTSRRISGFTAGAGYVWTSSRVDATVDIGPARFDVAAVGDHVVNVWMREDGLVVDKILITTNPNYTPTDAGPAESPLATPPPRIQDSGADGLLVLEAEHYSSKADSADGHTWTLVHDPAGFSGSGAMQALPNAGLNVQNDITISPHMDFNVKFTKTGTHYIWVRGVGDSGGASADDSVHVGLDGVLFDTSRRISGFTSGAGYVWTSSRVDATVDIGPARFDVAAGEHVINVWMREDGLIVDKILLTTNPNYIPTGVGPAESGTGESQPELLITRSGNQITITWAGNGILESADNILGPWNPVAGASSPFPVTTSGNSKFYRLH